MKVRNIRSNSGNAVPNQFVITDKEILIFQSYETNIAKVDLNQRIIFLDTNCLSYSNTTSKYLYQFLEQELNFFKLDKKSLQRAIKDGIIYGYIVYTKDLNNE